MDFGFNNYSYQNVPIQDLSSLQIPVQDGKSDTVSVTTPDIQTFLLSPYDSIDIEYNISSALRAPVRREVSAGTVTISINQMPVGSFPVYPRENIEKLEFRDIVRQILETYLAF